MAKKKINLELGYAIGLTVIEGISSEMPTLSPSLFLLCITLLTGWYVGGGRIISMHFTYKCVCVFSTYTIFPHLSFSIRGAYCFETRHLKVSQAWEWGGFTLPENTCLCSVLLAWINWAVSLSGVPACLGQIFFEEGHVCEAEGLEIPTQDGLSSKHSVKWARGSRVLISTACRAEEEIL